MPFGENNASWSSSALKLCDGGDKSVAMPGIAGGESIRMRGRRIVATRK